MVSELVEGLVERGHHGTLFATGDSRTSAELRALYPRPNGRPIRWSMSTTSPGRCTRSPRSGSTWCTSTRPPRWPSRGSARGCRWSTPSTTPTGRCSRAIIADYPEVQFVAISADQGPASPSSGDAGHPPRAGSVAIRVCTERPGGLRLLRRPARPRKGAHTAIDAAGLRGRAHPRRPVRPTPPDRAYAEREWSAPAPGAARDYLGAVGMAQKVPLLADARALLAPIDWDEPFGLILIEAMLSGCPVVAFRPREHPRAGRARASPASSSSRGGDGGRDRPGGPVDRIDRRRCRARAVQRFSRARMVAEHERLYCGGAVAGAELRGRSPIAAA